MASAAPSTDQPGAGIHEAIPALAECDQLVVATAADWNATNASVALYERSAGGRWQKSGKAFSAMLGRNGLAWGIGLHGSWPSSAAPKREGDNRSPAGVFAFEKIYSRGATRQNFHFPFSELSETFEGVDDSASRRYNRLFDSAQISERDWDSSEKIRGTNPLFRWLVDVKHNWEQFPGYGSCIYLHVWRGPGRPTSGCTAMAPESLERVVRWLDATKQPLLGQLPAAEYDRLRPAWALP
ncbi:MAG: hypothetical protein H0U99_06335 [Chthoniobacterales bacterium]|nr:hypothetical protein [Chthoniobacterales bacterium]